MGADLRISEIENNNEDIILKRITLHLKESHCL